MPVLDLPALLAPVPGEAPCGRDLEYAPEFMELTALAAEPDESVLKDVAAVDARNWRDVKSRSIRMLGQSKDLRIVALLARSTLHVDGVEGYCEAVVLGLALVEAYWADIHPCLADEGADAVARLNAVAELWSRPLLKALRTRPLVSARGLGEFSLRDILVARGQEKPRAGTQAPNAQLVQRALEGAQEAGTAADSARAAYESLQKIEMLVRERVPDHPFDPSPLRDVLTALRQALPHRASPAAAQQLGSDAGAHTAGMPVQQNDGVTQAPAAVVYREREVTSRDDVVAMLDRICAYYDRHEPSSPVPLLMQRARRLVNMTFLELMRDLADKGMPQIEAISGKDSKS